jgi:hypothetical protein
MAKSTIATLREKAEAAVKKGAKTKRSITITVRPASFTGKDDAIVLGVRVGKHFMVPEHVEALCEALGVTPDEDKFLALFESA